MHDLTKGTISSHIVRLATPIAAGMIFQTMYYLIDLYFVARLGGTAIAGVSAAGNVQFLIMALSQVLGVGTMVLVPSLSTEIAAYDAAKVKEPTARSPSAWTPTWCRLPV